MSLGSKNEEERGAPGRPARSRVLFLTRITLVFLLAAGLWSSYANRLKPALETKQALVTSSSGLDEAEATHAQVVEMCAGCHVYPPPEIFAKAQWPSEVERGYNFFREAKMTTKGRMPSARGIAIYYEKRAPEALPIFVPPPEPPPFHEAFERVGYRLDEVKASSSISNVRFLRLSDPVKFDVVACDMRHGMVLRLKPYQPDAKFEVLTRSINHPGHAEVLDLDGDGVKDLLIANLGSPLPTEQRLGSVVWLRGSADGTFTPITLADDVGRVADAQAADFDGDGDLDLIVAVFGRLAIGEILYFENQTTDVAKPKFVPKVIDPRHGTIHVPVADLNGDGRPDFVALISQEHEAVVAFLNTGRGQFDPHVIYEAPHPAFGSSGIELTDLDGDGDLDVLMSNGDVLDSNLLRPYHGIRWLENKGNYPFIDHPLTSLYGAHRAVAADFDGDGDLDIAATSFLPGTFYGGLREKMKLDAVLILEQTAPGTFVRHSIESTSCDHATCDAADYDGDGKPDLVLGNMFVPLDPSTTDANIESPWVVLLRNQGKASTSP